MRLGRLSLTVASLAALGADALDNGLGLTPPMSFSTWNSYECAYNESTVRAIVDTLVSHGYRDAGYEYVGMDDCYALKDRGPDGRIQIDLARFPSGFGPAPTTLTSYIHVQGLKVWVYSGTCKVGCEGYPGTLGNEQLDADTFAGWTADLLKLDNCQYSGDPQEAYAKVGAALNATGRPIFFMACSWGTNNPWIELPAIVNSYRIDHDNSPDFNDMLRIVSNAEGLAKFAGPGHFLDLDMLEVGNLGDEDAGTRTSDPQPQPPSLTATSFRNPPTLQWYTTTHIEADKAQFAIWCIYKSALTLGTTVENLQNATYQAILTNRELIAWNQDRLGVAGDVVRHEGPNRWLAGPLSDGSRAVVLFNAHTARRLRGRRPRRLHGRRAEHIGAAARLPRAAGLPAGRSAPRHGLAAVALAPRARAGALGALY
jgi:alpha-galactosidase